MAEDLELYRMELAPGGVHTSQGHTAGTEEFLTILAGKVEVSAGENRTELNAGDFLHYQSDLEHTIANRTDEPAELYMVVRFP